MNNIVPIILPALALLGGLIGLVKKDFLETIMALFLILYGGLNLADHFGVIDLDEVTQQARQATEEVIEGQQN